MILDKLYLEFLDFYSSIQDEYQHCGISEYYNKNLKNRHKAYQESFKYSISIL